MRPINRNTLCSSAATRQRGFTLLEVMVALVIFSIGLLGLADLQIKSVDYNNGAYQRSQASFLISDIMDRMRANKDYALGGSYDLNPGPLAKPTLCNGTSANCDGTAQAKADLYEWQQDLTVLPGGYGTISHVTNGPTTTFTVTITWDDPHGKLDISTGKRTSSLTMTGGL